MLQNNQSIDIDNDFTLHIQRVKLPRGNGNKKLAVNKDLNSLLKICVLQSLDIMMMSHVSVMPWP